MFYANMGSYNNISINTAFLLSQDMVPLNTQNYMRIFLWEKGL